MIKKNDKKSSNIVVYMGSAESTNVLYSHFVYFVLKDKR